MLVPWKAPVPSKRLPPTASTEASMPSAPTSKKRSVSPAGGSRSCSKKENVQIVAPEIVPLLEAANRIRLFVNEAPKLSAVTYHRSDVRS
jgi:hypothetical protein